MITNTQDCRSLDCSDCIFCQIEGITLCSSCPKCQSRPKFDFNFTKNEIRIHSHQKFELKSSFLRKEVRKFRIDPSENMDSLVELFKKKNLTETNNFTSILDYNDYNTENTRILETPSVKIILSVCNFQAIPESSGFSQEIVPNRKHHGGQSLQPSPRDIDQLRRRDQGIRQRQDQRHFSGTK